MEDLAHFIMSMSEKYGLLDVENKEFHDASVEQAEHRAGSSDDRSVDLVGKQDSLCDSIVLRESQSQSWDLGEDFNRPSSASWNSGSMKSKWAYLNNILCDNGFCPLDNSCMSSSPETFGKLFDTLDDVVRNYARREKLVQELLAERDALRQEDQRNDEVTLKLESDVETLKQKLAAAEQRAELAAAASGKAYAALRKEHQRLEATHASALQRCSQLEHVCRAKERSLRKVQEKIQEAVRREQSQRSRDRELYEKLKHKVAISQKAQGDIIESNFLLRDLKPACIVGIYERQRAASEAEMSQLREENSRLCKELREKENSLLSKAMSAIEADQAELDQREQKLIEQLTQAVNQRDVVKSENVENQVPLKPDSAENNISMLLLQRLQSDVAEDGRNNQLLKETVNKKLEYSTTGSNCETSVVNGCTNVKCQEFLQEVCSKLKIMDPLRLTDAIDSLLKVVTAVPRMETFIDNVCDVVFNEGCMFLTRETQGAEQTPEAVPDILKFWLQQVQYTEELQQFKDSVCLQLWERYDDKAEKHPMNCKLAEASVKDLINIERHYLLSQQSYREAQTLLKAEPQKLLHRIIGHFQMLFEIPRLEGVMAVMNSVYIQISEYHNFARALCSMLGLPKDSGANTIISTVTGILNKVSNLY